MKEIFVVSIDFRARLLKVEEKVQGQLTWVEANSAFQEHFSQNTVESLKIELALLDFGNKSNLRRTTAIENTLERCTEFYKKMRIGHNKC